MIYILVPSYNDSQNFQSLFKDIADTLKNIRYKIIIVDDGSLDKTVQVIKKLSKKYPLTRIGYRENKGPGYAFQVGFGYLIPKLKQTDIVVTMEADNSCDLSILKKMLSECNKYDIILSSPFAKGGKFLGIDKKRKVLGEAANFIDKIVFRIKGINTYSSFYRAYRADILKKAQKSYKSSLIIENGFSAVVELLIKLSKLNATFFEIPATLDWRKRKGKSKMKVGKTTVRHLVIYKNYFQKKYSL